MRGQNYHGHDEEHLRYLCGAVAWFHVISSVGLGVYTHVICWIFRPSIHGTPPLGHRCPWDWGVYVYTCRPRRGLRQCLHHVCMCIWSVGVYVPWLSLSGVYVYVLGANVHVCMFAEIQNCRAKRQNGGGLDSRVQGVYALEPAWIGACRGVLGFTLCE